MIVACPYCAGVIVLDSERVTNVAVEADHAYQHVTRTFLAKHRCPPGARRAYLRERS